MKKSLSIIILLIVIMLTASLNINAENEMNDVKAKVIKVNSIEEITKENEPTKKVQNVTVRILEGEYENEEYEMSYSITEDVESITSNIELEEDDSILVEIEEKEGEITSITYKETITQNYTLYIVGAILIILLLIIGRGKATKPIIIYLVTMILISFAFVFCMQKGWNPILTASILSLLITIFVSIKTNGLDKNKLLIILSVILSVAIAGIVINILFDIMGLTNINIKISESFVNIKELVCANFILIGTGICNAIIVSALNIDFLNNKPYKTKSDNIIEGQRSLKL